ncbi:MAG TPA: SulP family inorganic anion transporter [Cyclobacteriaceae bacterium]|nr:SulP family inorganic anion transporter [Cyclobacteriaceae bacterium]HRK53894.1 SulP family inorganic anion transporter [Cyclobacteriaceae bacterium]
MKLLDTRTIKGDLFGGVTAGIVALPLAMAFGVQSGLGAEAGLYGAIAIGIVAAIFGGTKTQISGPTGPMTVVSSLIAATAMAQAPNPEIGLALVLLTFFMAGVLQIVFGLTQVGKMVQFIPYPVVSGFMSGIGLIIIFLQLFPLVGHSSPNKIVDVFVNIMTPLQNMNRAAFMLGLLTIAIIYIFPRITKAVPSTLVALIAVSLIPQFVVMDIPKIGDIPAGLPHINFGIFSGLNMSNLGLVIIPAITLAALGSIDSLLTSVVADNITKTKHNSNRELIGQGLGNMMSALVGGIPGAGATMRTVVNVRSGGKTRISGVVHGLFLLIVLLGLGKYAAEIPLAVLAGILITVGIGIIDYKGLGDILKVPKADAIVKIAVVLMTVFVDLLWAVGVGLVLSALFFVKRSAEQGQESSTIDPANGHPDSDEELKEVNEGHHGDQVFIQEFHGPLFFGFSSKFQEQYNKNPNMKAVVFRFKHLSFADQSGMYALMDVIRELNSKNTWVLFSGLRENVKEQFKKIGIIPALVPESQCFENFEKATLWLTENLENKGSKEVNELLATKQTN